MTRLITWLDAKLVPQWRIWWKLWTMRVAFVVALLVTWLTSAPDALTYALNALPRDIRDSLPGWIGPVTFASLFLLRMWNQNRGKHDGS